MARGSCIFLGIEKPKRRKRFVYQCQIYTQQESIVFYALCAYL